MQASADWDYVTLDSCAPFARHNMLRAVAVQRLARVRAMSSKAATMPETAQRITEYWFQNIEDAGVSEEQREQVASRWFRGGDAVDAEIRDKFGNDVENAVAGKLASWTATAEGTLALVLLLDQFTRNVFRDTAMAFAADAQAQKIVKDAVAAGTHEELSPIRRAFLLMPLMHSENPEDGRALLPLLLKAAEDAEGSPLHSSIKSFHDFGVAHLEVLDRFGRYPHRNQVLGRKSTPEEEKYVADGGGW